MFGKIEILCETAINLRPIFTSNIRINCVLEISSMIVYSKLLFTRYLISRLDIIVD